MLGALRLARGARHRRRRPLVYFVIFRARAARARARARRSPDVELPEDERGATAHGAAAGAGVGHRRARAVHGLDRRSTPTTRRCSSAASCSSSASRGRPRAYQSRIELQGAAAGRLLPGRPGDPRRPARLVDRAGAGEPVGDAAVLRRDAPDRLQRQRADHLSGDAGAQPERRHEDRGRRRRGDRRRPDGDRQRAEPRRPGAAGPLLRRRRVAAVAAGRRAAADAAWPRSAFRLL